MSREIDVPGRRKKTSESKTSPSSDIAAAPTVSFGRGFQRAQPASQSSTIDDILHLQRTIGNRATGNLLAQRESGARSRGLEGSSALRENDVIGAKTHSAGAGPAPPDAVRPNRTGLPDRIKTGVETLSGFSMDDVRVHYNSDQPARIQAHAYTQGTNIYLARGQDKHLPHEAWHVVQQKQGRAQATRQLMPERVLVNDERALEHEADVMGARSASFDSRQGTNAPGLRTTPPLRDGSANPDVVQGVFYVDVIGADGKVDQVDLHKVDSVAQLEQLVWQMPDDELNDPDVREIIQATYVILQGIESEAFGARALSMAAAAKEAPSKWASSIGDMAKNIFGFGETGTAEEKGSLTEVPSTKEKAQSKQLGRDLESTAIDTVVGQGLSQGASLLLEHSVPGISMVVGAARSGQLIFRGQSTVNPIDLGVAAVAVQAKQKGYEEIPDHDPVSSAIKDAIRVLAKGQSLRGGGKLGSTATGAAVGIGVGAALTAPIGAVPGAIVGGILGSISGLIASIGIEKGTRDLRAEKNAVKTLVKVILRSNARKGRTVGPTRDRSVGYGSTDATETTSTSTSAHSGPEADRGQKSSRASRHQSSESGSGPSYQNAPVRADDQLNIDALAAYAALVQLGVAEASLRSLGGLEQAVLTQLKIG